MKNEKTAQSVVWYRNVNGIESTMTINFDSPLNGQQAQTYRMLTMELFKGWDIKDFYKEKQDLTI